GLRICTYFFFFQAEDGIRAFHVTGVQTCALPILDTVEGHAGFAQEVLAVKAGLVDFLVAAAREGMSVAGYGAPGKGNTLLNHCGIREDLLPYTVDRSPYKHGMYLPGTHIPIHPPERLAETRPDYIVILPWNLREVIGH